VAIVLVTRQGCHLCDQALSLLKELGTEPELADVDADQALADLYDWRVPVVMVDGKPVAEGKITLEQLQTALGGSGRGSGAA
jgi:glutaredoxin